MPRNSSRFTPQADLLEARMVLSAVLTPAGYEAAHNGIAQAVSRLAATGNVARADAALARAVQSIPDSAALLPTLDAAVATNPVTTRTLMADVNTFLRAEVATGDIVVSNAALRRTIGLVAATPPSSPPVTTAPPSTPSPPTTGSGTPATPPASLSVSIFNAVTNSDLNVSFTQVVNGVRTQLTGVFVRAGTTASFVPIITQSSSPITVSAQSPSVGYWQITAPTNFTQLEIKSMNGKCYFYFE